MARFIAPTLTLALVLHLARGQSSGTGFLERAEPAAVARTLAAGVFYVPSEKSAANCPADTRVMTEDECRQAAIERGFLPIEQVPVQRNSWGGVLPDESNPYPHGCVELLWRDPLAENAVYIMFYNKYRAQESVVNEDARLYCFDDSYKIDVKIDGGKMYKISERYEQDCRPHTRAMGEAECRQAAADMGFLPFERATDKRKIWKGSLPAEFGPDPHGCLLFVDGNEASMCFNRGDGAANPWAQVVCMDVMAGPTKPPMEDVTTTTQEVTTTMTTTPEITTTTTQELRVVYSGEDELQCPVDSRAITSPEECNKAAWVGLKTRPTLLEERPGFEFYPHGCFKMPTGQVLYNFNKPPPGRHTYGKVQLLCIDVSSNGQGPR